MGATCLFFRGSTLLYWISDCYPTVPILNTDVQTTWLLQERPEALLASLDDPHLALVEFDPAVPALDDPTFLDQEANRDLLRKFNAGLERRFVRLTDSPEPYAFWAPRT